MGMRKLLQLLMAVVALMLTACENAPEKPVDEVSPTKMHKSTKRGVAFGKADCAWEDADLPLITPAISWTYNWGEQPQDEIIANWFDVHDVEFCPMTWNGNYNANRIRNYVTAHPKTKYLLAFNEPNLTDQARMTPQQAAQKWPALKQLAQELGLQLVSPAMNYGTLPGYGDPIKWLDEFFACDGVSLDDIDAIAVHCYMASPAGLQSFVEKFAKYGKPVWVTEFCAWEDYAIHSAEDQMKYMCQVLHYMEQDPQVERYAWFIPRAKSGYPYMQLLTNERPFELTDAGKVYCGISSFDKSAWMDGLQWVSAADYVGLSSNAIQVRPSTDSEHLMLSLFKTNEATEYQICLTRDISSIAIRYASVAAAVLLVYVDGVLQTMIDMPPTGSDLQTWDNVEAALPITKGKHTVKIEVHDGMLNMDSFKFL